MKEIKLTEEQKAAIEPHLAEWTKKMRSTERADWTQFEIGIRACYTLAKMEQPRFIVHVASPLILSLAGPLAGFAWEHDAPAKQRRHAGYLVEKISEIINWSEMTPDYLKAITDAALKALGGGLKAEALLLGATGEEKKCREYIKYNWWACMAGQMWAGWHAYASFIHGVVRYPLPPDLVAKVEATALADMSAYWSWPHERFVMACDRPCDFHIDEQGRFHCVNGLALGFTDGFGIASVHGVQVKPWIILNPERIKPKDIEAEDNAEVRRIMLEKFGYKRFIEQTDAKLISQDEYGKLYEKRLPNEHPMRFIEVENPTPSPDGSYKKYFLDVAGLERKLGWPIKTAHDAVAATWGKKASDFNPIERA